MCRVLTTREEKRVLTQVFARAIRKRFDVVKAFPWVLNLGALGAWDLAILFSRTLRRALLDSYGGGVHNIRALNISRGNPSLTDSVRLEWLLNFASLKPCKR